ncbi:hypothetical protein THRCLA_09563 [Thraustotheca clavata]|uniref:Protein kinase domain-containing protein n=1 Tax=Thraustotheca clavata TaxID=74557 RepID=A0A1V9YW89_9STRA|nr:hypothetical protein THRCLA_09563 [Thraustotheca clavata]
MSSDSESPRAVRGACMSPLSSSEDEFAFKSRKRGKNVQKNTTSKRKKSVVKKISKKKKLNEAPEPYVTYLLENLKEGVQSKLSFEYGFGSGALIPLPTGAEWKKSDTTALAQWLEELGFKERQAPNAVLYRIPNSRVASIVKKLHPTSLPVEKDTKLVLPNFHLPLDEELEYATVPAAPIVPPSPVPTLKPQKKITTPIFNPRLHWGTSPILPIQRPRFSIDGPSPIAKLSPQVGDQHSIDVSLDLDDAPDDGVTKRINFASTDIFAKKTISPIREEQSDDFVEIIEPTNQSIVQDDLFNTSRDDINIQVKKRRNHQRRLSRLERTDRRKSFFLSTRYVDKEITLKRRAKMPDAVATLVLSSGMLQMNANLVSVSKHWRKTCYEMIAWTRADQTVQYKWVDQTSMVAAFPWGQYIADGAYKSVYKVFSVDSQSYEALSVMDIRSIEELGNETIVRQEIAHSLLFSNLVETGVCPNFLRIHQVFLHPFGPYKNLWGSAENLSPQGAEYNGNKLRLKIDASEKNTIASYQYCTMELCDGGNLEDYLRVHGTLSVHDSLCLFFQMVFALYVGRDQHELRHFDIKLLNFFLKSMPKVDSAISYTLNKTEFTLKSPHNFWIKLADFGSADTQVNSLHDSIGIEHFTTFENAPMEYFVIGDAAEAGYAVDTFALGLCLLHLMTGSVPYEELLQDAVCPNSLKKHLVSLWKNKRPKKGESYTILQKILRREPENADILCDTVYRYCVLFGLDTLTAKTSVATSLTTNLIPKARSRHKTADQLQFECDTATYSLKTGSHHSIQQARDRINSIDGAMDDFLSLVNFDPKKRPTMLSVLTSPLFSMLQGEHDKPDAKVTTYARSYLKNV